MRSIGLPEIIIIFLVAIVLFGGKKLADVGKGLGEGIRNFKDAFKEDQSKKDEPAKKDDPVANK